ncbi:ABC-type uncharacterized transport system, substrate-binding protein [Loktanella fryxellensis]|uniref:ABC-type uncharacterized transport system, substrate-binding protein n=1 Tax=Loktanella fryxellensis TaxID=245187 RepID=A0A1H8JEA5_9RHOB|nr:DUF1007 family protein [Loktanella fryxellensis]SEN78537.1 ABC-type uncharacterized transport system, substrate-binding protein [Loktanella fryxellensis]
MRHLSGGILSILIATGLSHAALAHPHVFVDGGVDFVMADDRTLTALSVTWLYDEFETLYDLSSRGIDLPADGTLSDADREVIRAAYSVWPEDFDGSAHLTIDSERIALDWPSDLAVDLIDGRLQLVFRRNLPVPIDLTGKTVETAFYERTYFFAFRITDVASFIGPSACDARVIPYAPDAQSAAAQDSLAMLGREETPAIADVGRLFADRIAVTCE